MHDFKPPEGASKENIEILKSISDAIQFISPPPLSMLSAIMWNVHMALKLKDHMRFEELKSLDKNNVNKWRQDRYNSLEKLDEDITI